MLLPRHDKGTMSAPRITKFGTDKPVCVHRNSTLGYLAAHADADKRMKRGEKQRKCPVCLKWIWESEYYPVTTGGTP